MHIAIEPNLHRLSDALKELLDKQETIKPRAVMESLDQFMPDVLKPEDPENFNRLLQKLTFAYSEFQSGSVAEGFTQLAEVHEELQPMLPRFRIVLLNESHLWNDKDLLNECGHVWGAYLYDENRKVHIADISPSYELHYLFMTPENVVSEATREKLDTINGPEGDTMSYYCRVIDGIGWDRKHWCGRPQDHQAEGYDAMVEAEIEHYRANHVFELPRQPSTTMLLAAAIEQFATKDKSALASTLEAFTASADAALQDLAQRIRISPGTVDDEAFKSVASAAAREGAVAEVPQG